MENTMAESSISLSNISWKLPSLAVSLGSAPLTQPPSEGGGAS